MKELQEQLTRCKEWLKEEPDDLEVINKVKELEEKIKLLENEKEEEEKEEEKKNYIKKIEDLRKEIFSLKRRINAKFPKFNNIDDDSLVALKEIDDSMKLIDIQILEKKIDEFNNLVENYNKIYS